MSTIMIQSTRIENLVQFAIADGNEVVEVSEGWTKVKQVVHMRRPLSPAIQDLATSQGLRHWSVDPTPHNKAEEGFTDDLDKVSVSFPCR